MKNISAVLFIIFLFSSCVSKKEMIYFQDLKNNDVKVSDYNASRIQINDILYIKVSSLDEQASELFNVISSNNSSNVSSTTLKLQSYIVSPDGEIVFPVVGNIVVAGKTIVEVQELIKRKLEQNNYLLNATINVRIVNSKVTILGEVKNPGTFEYSEQNLTLPQAIGYAGDLTIYGKRNDILLIRMEDGKRTYAKLDLTSTQLLDGPYYYVKQNDVIIVNPNYTKFKSAGIVGNLGTALSIFSLTLTIYLILRK